jgi:hypothetical protein
MTTIKKWIFNFQHAKRMLFCSLLLSIPFGSIAQSEVLLNLAPVDGISLTPDNIFNYQIQSAFTAARDVVIDGTVRYRGSDLKFNYQFRYTLRPGMNMLGTGMVRPEWNFSSTALRELFLNYKKLPQGTIEYCVRVTPTAVSGELMTEGTVEECIYTREEDLFLINLIEPEDDAKIYERNPMLSWVVNYPFASQLTYRVRVAEIKQNQNTVNAISRNNPVFDQRNVMQTSIVYPVYAKPLVTFQPYAWVVDAYYKGMLLGGAEPWKFTIIEDSVLKSIPRNNSYIDIDKESGQANVYAVGVLKLKYVLEERRRDSLSLQLLNSRQQEVRIKDQNLVAQYGDNRFDLVFSDDNKLRHLETYSLVITSETGRKYVLSFRYVNPDFIQ